MEKNTEKPRKKQKKYEYRVICRVRPLLRREIEYAGNTTGAVFEILSNRFVSLVSEADKPRALFQFDKVFAPDTTPEEFFDNVAAPAVHGLWRGKSHTIMAYGPTGTGKTYSIFGSDNKVNTGVVPFATFLLFELAKNRPSEEQLTITCSFYEIYNESLHDLLDPTRNEQLRVREDIARNIYIDHLCEESVHSATELQAVIQRGVTNRLIHLTQMSMNSSRSHAIVRINVCRSRGDKRTSSVLTFVDLAGSERPSRAHYLPNIREASNINKSLTVLGRCFQAIQSCQRHVPFRDSKLTRLITTSLNKSIKTTVVLTCSPHHSIAEETLNSLKFGKLISVNYPNLGNIMISLFTILMPVDQGLFSLLPAELTSLVLQLYTNNAFAHKQLMYLITRAQQRDMLAVRMRDMKYTSIVMRLWDELIELVQERTNTDTHISHKKP
jgi:hypothetical protein